MDLVGIENQNEFFTDHYVHVALEKDITGWAKKQREAKPEADHPWQQLQRLRPAFVEAEEAFRRTEDPVALLKIQRGFVKKVLNALGISTSKEVLPVSGGIQVPTFAREPQQLNPNAPVREEADFWALEAFDAEGLGEDVMQLRAHALQIGESKQDLSMEKLVSAVYFERDPPRWLLVVSLRTFVLYERTRWSSDRCLRFDWETLFNRRTSTRTFQLIAMALGKESLSPGQESMLDKLLAQSRAHAQGVSSSLKYALRESVELLGNEAKVGPEQAEELTLECLRYLYRLLFLFTVEARPELGYLPMNAPVYRDGYSLEKIRDLEVVPLTEGRSAEGTFIDQALRMLFTMVFEGYTEPEKSLIYEKDTFNIAPLKCDLFDPRSTPILSQVKVRNVVWQRIIRLLSLGKSKKGGLGRISYAQLGINHLGSVYESLLSYQGFIAKEDLWEVRKRGEPWDVLEPAYFVGRDALEEHFEDEEERVYNDDGTLKHYPKGTFIYRLTGRAKESSASYYTPERLTQLTVKFALKEALEGKTADEILKITVCEPAMGSAAFLNEAVTQLAQAYLDKKCKEREETLSAERYGEELQRVKMYLADNNVYGVDLNPTAVELGGVSLWLNTLVPGGFVPWFGNQLRCGNSLIGAWRNVYSQARVQRAKWWTEVPEEVKDQRPPDGIYHFLLGDAGMASYKDKVVKSFAGEEIAKINAWRRGFTKPLTASEASQLVFLSGQIDSLWEKHVQDLEALDERTTDPFSIYPEPPHAEEVTSTRRKQALYDRVLEKSNSSAYVRLQLVMDYWCALWYWPIAEADKLPTRAEYLSDIAQVLAAKDAVVQTNLFGEETERDLFGFVPLTEVIDANHRLRAVEALAERYRFLHWQLEFADVFLGAGGFDVVLGNPPWIKPVFGERFVMGDVEPRFVTKKLTAPEVARLREEWLQAEVNRLSYQEAYEAVAAQNAFLGSQQSYPLLRGMQKNLYKAFLCAAWKLSTGSVGLLHPDSVYDEAAGGFIRKALYPRLRWRLQFHNQLFLFRDIGDRTRFGVNVYGCPQAVPTFISVVNLFAPETVEISLKHDGFGPVPGIKDGDGRWAVEGHKERVIRTGIEDLKTYAALFDKPGTPALMARLPAIHATSLSSVLRKLAQAPKRLRDFEGEIFISRMWEETGAQKDGTIRRQTGFASNSKDWILSGPHFFVGNPLFQTPNQSCRSKGDYSRIDLTVLAEDYRPRSNYVPACEEIELMRRTPKTPWGVPTNSEYRVVMRAMLSLSGERTLNSAMVPKDTGHIHTIKSIGATQHRILLAIAHSVFSIVSDCLIKVGGKGFFTSEQLSQIPIVECTKSAIVRLLGLSCLTQDYAELWNSFSNGLTSGGWAKFDKRLHNDWFNRSREPWAWDSPLRTDFARRQALVELDVLHAQAIGLTLGELRDIFRIQFPVLQGYENDTWYDRKGRIIFSAKSGEGGLPRTKRPKDKCYGLRTPQGNQTGVALGWEDIRYLQEGVVTYTFADDTLPGGPVERTIEYHAPFDRCDREEDYKEAWEYFERLELD